MISLMDINLIQVIWKHLVLSTVAEIKQAIKKIHDSRKYGVSGWEYEDLSELAHRVAIELGKDPENDKLVMARIYKVMSMPDVKEILEKKGFPLRR